MAANPVSSRVARRRYAGTSVVAILPLYNGEAWVEAAITSVLSQTILPNEFIVVDDGSTDGGVEIVKRLAAKYPLIKMVSQPNGGQSAARNFAIGMSSCEYVALIDQDDIWYPNHIEELLRAIRAHRGLRLGWAYSDFDDIDLDGRMVARDFIGRGPTNNPKRDLVIILRQGFLIQPSATLIKRSAIIEVGGFDERLSGYEDDDLFLRIFLANYDNVFVPGPTSQWRIHASSSGGSDRMEASLRTYTAKLLDSFPNDPWRGIYYRSDIIAPRMIKTWIAMYIRASRYKNRAKMRLYAREARALLRYLRPRERLAYWMVLLVMRNPLFIRASTARDESSIAWAPFIAIGHRMLRL